MGLSGEGHVKRLFVYRGTVAKDRHRGSERGGIRKNNNNNNNNTYQNAHDISRGVRVMLQPRFNVNARRQRRRDIDDGPNARHTSIVREFENDGNMLG